MSVVSEVSPATCSSDPPAAPPLTCRRLKGLRHVPLPRRSNLSLAAFWEEYGRPSKPVILAGALTDWPASHRWSSNYLASVCGDRPLQHECRDTMHRYIFRTQLKALNRSLKTTAWASLQDVDPAAEGLHTVRDLLHAQRTTRPELYLHDQSISMLCPALLDDLRAPRFFPIDLLRQVPSSDARQGRHDAASCAKSWHPSIFVGEVSA